MRWLALAGFHGKMLAMSKSLLFNETYKNIYSLLKEYGSMQISTIIKKYLDKHGEVLIENQVQDFIFYNKNFLHLEIIKTKRSTKYLIGRKDMKGLN